MKTIRLSILILCALGTLNALAHNRLQLEYVENAGQWHPNALYKISYGGGAVFLENNCFTYAFCHPDDRAKVHDYSQWSAEQQAAFHIRSHAWKMHFVGAQSAEVTGGKQQKHYYNYFLGNDPSKWASHVGIYDGVNYENLYPGIDLRCGNRGSNFKYDFIVRQGGDIHQIGLQFEGLDGVSIEEGKLALATSVGTFYEAQPYAYQVIAGKITDVACHYVLENGVVRFAFPEGYNSTYDLIIDPELIGATLSGTVGNDNYGHTATFDLAGDIYTGAISFGTGYPATTGAFDESFNGSGWGTDIAVSHLTADASDLIWASYLGGTEGDYPHSLVVNSLQELYVYGSTNSTNFPTTAGAYDESHNGSADIVISRFSSDGTQLIGSTYLGGSEMDGRNSYAINYGDTYRGEIILDPNERPVIASFTQSGDYPTTVAAYQSSLVGGQDAIVARFNTLLTNLEASTYLGSSSDDSGYGVKVTASGNLVIAGMAGDDDFPVTAGAYQTTFLGGGNDMWNDTEADGFITVMSPNATQVLASTYFGTDNQDQIFFIDLDNNEDIFVYGQAGADIPIVGDVYSVPDSRQFIAKFDQSLSAPIVSTTIGSGNGDDAGFDFVPIAFLVDHCNNIYISSHNAYSSSLPLTADALYGAGQGSFYLAVFSEDIADLEFGTMYTSNHVDGGTSRFDKNGSVYQAVCSGGDFAATPGAWAENQATGWDIGVFKINFDVSGVNSAISANDNVGCAPYEIQFENYSVGDQFYWDFGDGTTSTEETPVHVYEDPGLYTVSLIVSDSLSCNLADTSVFEISISSPQDITPEFTWDIDCATMGISCTNNTGIDYIDYIWNMGDGTILDTYDADYNYAAPGTYEVTLQAIDNGCNADETIAYEITIYDEVVAAIGNATGEGCAPLEATFESNGSGDVFTWDFGDGSDPVTGSNVNHTYTDPGTYTVTLFAEGTGDCTGSSSTEMTVTVDPSPVVNPEFAVYQIDDCELKTVEIENLTTGDPADAMWDMGDGQQFEVFPGTYSYDQPGTYTITLTLTDQACGQAHIFETEVLVIDQLPVDMPPNASICHTADGVTLEGPEMEGDAAYYWSTGEETQNIYVTDPGTYTLTVTANNCTGIGGVVVSEIPQWQQSLEMVACEGTQTEITIPYADAQSFEWCEGEATPSINVNEPGDYCFVFLDEFGCMQEGIIHLTHIAHDASIYIPNAFTPNNDGVNDFFQPVGDDTRFFRLSVWNRWGDLVFSSEDPSIVWDGSYQGQDHYVPNGIYTFSLVYASSCSAEKVVKEGHVTVIR
ncbi:MAG: PKD domain-containing protein [Flavobacteriales bacterium]|nr:PKD domain-containing protein [Flavobacteriales bacterium]